MYCRLVKEAIWVFDDGGEGGGRALTATLGNPGCLMMEGGKREREEGGEQPTSGRPLPLLPADCWRALKGCRNPDIHSNLTHEDSQLAADQLIFSLPVVISNPDNGETQQSNSRRSNSVCLGVS